jgi:hypothetical protein
VYCKKCGSDKHWTLYCDKEVKDGTERVCIPVGSGGIVSASVCRKSDNSLSRERDTPDGGGVQDVPDRFARWKDANRDKYNSYMREYMKKKRKKVVDNP